MIELNYKNFTALLDIEFPNFKNWTTYKEAFEAKDLAYIYTAHFVEYIDNLFEKDVNSREFHKFLQIINEIFTGTDKMLMDLIMVQVFEKWLQPPMKANLVQIQSKLNNRALKALKTAGSYFKE